MGKYNYYICKNCGGFQRSPIEYCRDCVRCGSSQLTMLPETHERVIEHKRNNRKGKLIFGLFFGFIALFVLLFNLGTIMENIETKSSVDTGYSNGNYGINSSSGYKQENTNYKMWKGMNGTYTYRCNRTCSNSCKYCKNSCVKGRENFGSSCTHEYSANSPIGWIGCPLCGDVDNSYWHDWYEMALKNSYN